MPQIKFIKLTIQFFSDEEFRKKAIYIILIGIGILMIPMFIVVGLDHTIFSNNKNNNFIEVQKNIYQEYNVGIDTDILRAIDTVLYNGDDSIKILTSIVNKDIIYKKITYEKKTIQIPEKYTVTEIKKVPVQHIENINGKIITVTTMQDKKVKEEKVKEVNHTIIEKKVQYIARNLDETVQYMIKKGYINEQQGDDIKSVYQLEKMLAPSSSYIIGGENNPFGGKMTHELPMSDKQFIQTVGTLAQEVYKQYGGELPSLTVAQAIDESGWGRSTLASKYNNLFGIKAFDWNGAKVDLPTYEYVNGVKVYCDSYFRVYPNWKDSIIDHGNFILENSRYHNMLGCTSYVQQANDLVIDGYATNPAYADNLIVLIREYGLNRFD